MITHDSKSDLPLVEFQIHFRFLFFTKQVTEGLHRCTTKTEHWEWKPASTETESDFHHADVDVPCQDKSCRREIHAFRLKHLNGILIFTDPPHLCSYCKPPLIFDGPLEGV